mmetsp:Transcript_14781/g.34646  ORF Transcript_14781/g.34646 Transcript_14781/m.34646 type:complete len:202 (-) Transcript_14781:2584-3189(-)
MRTLSSVWTLMMCTSSAGPTISPSRSGLLRPENACRPLACRRLCSGRRRSVSLRTPCPFLTSRRFPTFSRRRRRNPRRSAAERRKRRLFRLVTRSTTCWRRKQTSTPTWTMSSKVVPRRSRTTLTVSASKGRHSKGRNLILMKRTSLRQGKTRCSRSCLRNTNRSGRSSPPSSWLSETSFARRFSALPAVAATLWKWCGRR